MTITAEIRPSAEEAGKSRTSVTETPRCSDPLSRWVLAGLAAFFFLVTFVQSPGLIVDDTKLPVVMAPWAWMKAALHLWNQSVSSGSVQDQTFGYLFPMAPFFELTHVLHIPTWCAERIWLALLLTIGAWGIVRLSEALGIGKPWARVLGGLVYCVAPIVVTWAGSSGTLLAVVLLPWTVQPLVVGSRVGSPRRAAARSGVAVALMGGINATVVLATLPVGLLWLITRAPSRRRRSLTLWWLVSIALACFWWVVPTLLQGRYGYNYVPYTESSVVTTSTASAFEALRGASYWTDYYNLGSPLIPGAWTLVTAWVAVMATATVTAIGLAGLARRIPERLFLVASLAVGVAIIAVGYSGPLAGPLSLHVQTLLQGGLAPLRSVAKFSPDVAMPVAIGVAWFVSTVSAVRMKARLSDWPSLRASVTTSSPDIFLPLALGLAWLASRFSIGRTQDGESEWSEVRSTVTKSTPDIFLPLTLGTAWFASRIPSGRLKERLSGQANLSRTRLLVGSVAVLALFLAAMPLWQGELYPSGGFTAIPHYWSETASWLDAHQGDQTALLVPGASFADYTWGKPQDEPLAVLSSSSVTTRSIIPLGSNGNTDMLSAVQNAIATGTAERGMAEYLSRSGISYVVERNDLNLTLTGAPPPAIVHQVLSETSGLTEVASFGPYLPVSQVAHGTLPVYNSPSSLRLRPVEIYKVEPPASEVQTFSASNPLVVSGSSGSLLPLAGTGILAGRATVLANDPKAGDEHPATIAGATWAITDGNQRRAVTFGTIYNNLSYLLGPHQRPSGSAPGSPLGYGVVLGSRSQTVAAPIGAKSVSSSSYGSTPLYNEPAEGPASAFDGDASTAWVANAVNNSVGQSVSITLNRSVPVTSIAVTPLDDSPARPTISRLEVTTDRGSVVRAVPRHAGTVDLAVEGGNTRHLTLTIKATRPSAGTLGIGALGAGIVDVAIPGVTFHPAMKVPADEVASFSKAISSQPVINFDAPVANANFDLGDPTGLAEPMARKFELAKPMSAAITGIAVPSPNQELETLLSLWTPPSQSLQISASSWLGSLPKFRPANLIQHSTTPWIAGLGDPDPSLTLTWSGSQQIDSINLRFSKQASRPTRLVLSSAAGRREVAVPEKGGTITFAPLTTDSLTVHLVGPKAVTLVPSSAIPIPLPLGLAAISVPALQEPVPAPASAATPVNLPCGAGPTMTIDGIKTETAVSGTLGDLVDLTPMTYRACTLGTVRLAAGNHVITFPGDSAFVVTGLLARSPGSGYAASAERPRSARITSWGPEHRTVSVKAGPATYLQVSDNFNPAWTATLAGRTLRPVRLDGWQQGWIVPAGAAGTVTMTMGPDKVFRTSLLVGAVLLLVLAAVALVRGRRPNPAPVGRRRRLPGWLLGGAATLVAVAVGGWLALVLIPLVAVARRWGSSAVAGVAGISFFAAGVIVAWQPSVIPNLHQGAFGAAAQVASVIALCAVLSAVVVGERRRHEVVGPPPVDAGV
jgi:arabinofuranan 3-O-arabinosyltransferase